jgi:alkanesulfonate monooxygenase SsuD/methylene tetrahydromethanopterin reductase-like flavin-dependent oxidoreductase (luciferase family)
LEFGIGAAWHEGEHRGYGIDFPPPSERIDRLDEALTIIKMLWTQETATFKGRFWSLDEAMCYPKPVQQPRPPIVVGGSGEKKTLRVVAKHADEWNGLAATPDEWARLNKILDEHCDAVGRDPKEIRRGVQLFLMNETAEFVVQQLPGFEDAGCEHAVLSFYTPPTREMLERFAPKG